MNIIEYITNERKGKKVSHTEFTKAMGISHQRFYQIMGQDDCRFGIARKMLKVLGKDFDIQKPDGSRSEVNAAETFAKLEEANAMFSNAEAMVAAIGLTLAVIDLSEETHKETQEGEEISE